MPLIDTNHGRAALVVLLLGAALLYALAPYATGIIGSPVLYAVVAPVHDRMPLLLPHERVAEWLEGRYSDLSSDVPLVGIGASAGGVEALSRVIKPLPANVPAVAEVAPARARQAAI